MLRKQSEQKLDPDDITKSPEYPYFLQYKYFVDCIKNYKDRENKIDEIRKSDPDNWTYYNKVVKPSIKNKALAKEIAACFYALREQDNNLAYTRLKENNLLDEITGILKQTYLTLETPITRYKETWEEKDKENNITMKWGLFCKDKKKVAHSTLEEAQKKIEINSESEKQIFEYKSKLQATVDYLRKTDEKTEKSKIDLIRQNKSPIAIRVMEAVASVASIIGIPRILVLMRDAKKHKGGYFKLFHSEGETVNAALKKVEKDLTPSPYFPRKKIS